MLRDVVSFVQFKKREKKSHGGKLFLVELQDKRLKACNFTKSNTPPCVFFTFSKLYKWCQIAQTKNIGELNNILDMTN